MPVPLCVHGFHGEGNRNIFFATRGCCCDGNGTKKILFILAHSYQLRLKVQMYDLIEVMAGTP